MWRVDEGIAFGHPGDRQCCPLRLLIPDELFANRSGLERSATGAKPTKAGFAAA